MERQLKTIGILTSGGDAPGMNAAIRAVTRTARFHDMNVIGVMRGYQGLIDKEFVKFTSSSVSNTIQRGGTILKTARSKEFMTEEGRKKAYENMVEAGMDALVVIGGNGSLTGAGDHRQRPVRDGLHHRLRQRPEHHCGMRGQDSRHRQQPRPHFLR